MDKAILEMVKALGVILNKNTHGEWNETLENYENETNMEIKTDIPFDEDMKFNIEFKVSTKTKIGKQTIETTNDSTDPKKLGL